MLGHKIFLFMHVTLISGDSDDEVEDKSLQKLAVALGAKEKKKKKH